jgi:hypothetical protein
MTISGALRRGIETLTRMKRMTLLFYAAAALPALLITGALMTVFFQSLGTSAWTARLGESFDLDWVAEIAAKYDAMPLLPLIAAALGIIAAAEILHLFLLGGALAMFRAREPFHAAPFFAGCGRNFWKLVRLALLSLVCYAIAAIPAVILAAIGKAVWGDGSEARPLILWGWLRLAVLVCLLGYVNLVFDYARLRLASGSEGAFRAGLMSFRLVGKRFQPTAALYVALWAIFGVVVAAYFGLSRLIPPTPGAVLLLLFLLQQAFVLARTWVRLLFYAAQSQMFDALVPRLLIRESLRESPAPGVAPDMPTLPEPPPEAA